MAEGVTTWLATGMAVAAERKAQLGQFFTPPPSSGFVAGLFAAGTGMRAACWMRAQRFDGNDWEW